MTPEFRRIKTNKADSLAVHGNRVAVDHVNVGGIERVAVCKGPDHSSGVNEVAENFDIEANAIKEMLEGLSLILMQPLPK